MTHPALAASDPTPKRFLRLLYVVREFDRRLLHKVVGLEDSKGVLVVRVIKKLTRLQERTVRWAWAVVGHESAEDVTVVLA